jgi:hypothetical protein
MIVIANKAIARGGWRAGYVAMAVPMVLIAAPLVLFVVRGRPSSASTVEEPKLKQPAPVVLQGVESSEAFRTRSFWLIGIAGSFYACAIGGILVNVVVYLIAAGYTTSLAALVASA